MLCQPGSGCAQYITLLTLLHLSQRITSIKDHITVIVTECDLLTIFCSVRSSRSHNLRPCGPSLSRALNLHHIMSLSGLSKTEPKILRVVYLRDHITISSCDHIIRECRVCRGPRGSLAVTGCRGWTASQASRGTMASPGPRAKR